MKKRHTLTLLLILCLMAMFLTACAGVELPLGHRYGNPEITFADGKVVIKYLCADCDFYEIEERAVSTQVADAQAWDKAFQNLNMEKYSLAFRTTSGEKTEKKHCIVTEDKGYYAELSSDGVTPVEEFYTLQKDDGTFVTYVRSGEDGMISLAPENNGFYLENLKNQSGMYYSFEGKFEQFTYDPESGSYICSQPVEGQLNGTAADVRPVKTLQNVSVSVADGQILCIKVSYSEINAYLEEVCVDVCLYNIGYSAVKVPKHFIEAVIGKSETLESGVFTYQLRDGKVTITGVNTAVGGVLPVPAFLDGYPVVAIGEGAFKGCVNVTEIVIPDSVSTIGDNAFLGCAGLSNVKYGGTQAQWSAITIGEIGNTPLLNATIQFSEACAHTWDAGTIVKQSTCGAAGIKVHTCTVCGAQKPEYLSRLNNHSYDSGVVTEEATCRDAGMKVYTCTECGKSKTEYVPRLSTHTYINGTCVGCGADDPKYVQDTDKEIGGIVGAFIRLFESLFDIFSFFR